MDRDGSTTNTTLAGTVVLPMIAGRVKNGLAKMIGKAAMSGIRTAINNHCLIRKRRATRRLSQKELDRRKIVDLCLTPMNQV